MSEPLLLHGLTILLVEDQYFVAMELASMLQNSGAKVLGPVSALPLQPEMQQAAIDVALLDLNLRGNSVFPLADALSGRSIPVALFSGYGREVLPSPYRDFP